jgi:hypothetical protein
MLNKTKHLSPNSDGIDGRFRLAAIGSGRFKDSVDPGAAAETYCQALALSAPQR